MAPGVSIRHWPTTPPSTPTAGPVSVTIYDGGTTPITTVQR